MRKERFVICRAPARSASGKRLPFLLPVFFAPTDSTPKERPYDTQSNAVRPGSRHDARHAALAEQARAELEPEFAALLDGDEAAVFLLFADGKAAGFAHCQLRHDYVEGTDSSPVGYLEGIYVEEALRRRGHARALLAACETWAAGRGCTEFASDCELGNEASRAFHLHAGFDEANRIVCFAKRL